MTSTERADCFRAPDNDSLLAWYRDSAVTAGAQRASALHSAPRLRLLRRVDRSRDRDEARDREILERDHYRCRYCSAPLVHVDHLRRLGRIVGDDVLSGETAGSWRRGGHASSPSPLWLLTCGTTDAAMRTRSRRRTSPPDLVAACLPCHRGIVGLALDEVGLDDPRGRPPDEFPDWYPLLDLLDHPPETAYALVDHALLLDGSTLNLAGRLVGRIALDATVQLTVSCQDAPLATTSITTTRTSDDGLAFHGHLVLAETLRGEPAPEHLDVELRLGDDSLRLFALPGSTETPNRAYVEPIAELTGLGRRIRFVTVCGIRLQLDSIPSRADVAAIEVSDSTISLVIVPSSAAEADAVWIQRRGASVDAARVDLVRDGSGSWVLTPDVRLVPSGVEEVVLWDTWVSWTAGRRQLTERAGRLSSDLLSVRDAVLLPPVACEVEDQLLRVRPYFTHSRHLAMRVSIAPSQDGST